MSLRMEQINTINRNSSAEIVEKKSKFIAQMFYVDNLEDAEEIIKKVKKKYHDARHNVFAYAIEGENDGLLIKFNDDGEPSKSAGAPILKIILEKGLSNVLVVVTRYFGGVLLGTGGLVKAYSEATIKAIDANEIITKVHGYEVEIKCNYQEIKKIEYFLEKNKIKVIKKQYLEDISINIEISSKLYEELKMILNNEIKCNIISTKFVDI